MPFTTTHSVEKGLYRLMNGPRDLPASAPWRDPPVEYAMASEAHKRLFEEYEQDMEGALDLAEQWWEDRIQRRIARGIDIQTILDESYAVSFAGPAGKLEIVWVVRKFWLRCVELNRERPEAERVPPEVFLLHWLDDGQHPDHVQVLTGMPYWPVGLDEHGNWV